MIDIFEIVDIDDSVTKRDIISNFALMSDRPNILLSKDTWNNLLDKEFINDYLDFVQIITEAGFDVADTVTVYPFKTSFRLYICLSKVTTDVKNVKRTIAITDTQTGILKAKTIPIDLCSPENVPETDAFAAGFNACLEYLKRGDVDYET